MYQTYLVYAWYIPCICMVYALHILVSVISLVLQAFKEAIKTGWIGNTCTLHGVLGQLLDSTHKAWFTVRQDIARIYHGYTIYIPDIYHAKVTCEQLSCPSALGSLGPGLPSDLLSFGHREATHARLGPSKVPQPGVDLVNMAAPRRGRASTIGTAALKSVPLSADVLMWNSWGCISVQKSWNERDSAEEAVNPS